MTDALQVRIRGRFHPLSDFELEAYLCEELDAAGRARVEETLARSQELQAYIDERRAARASFAERHPLSRRRSQRLAAGWKLWLAGSALAAAAALLSVSLPTSRRVPGGGLDTVRAKGNTLQAELYVKRGDAVWVHQPEIAVQPGDALRLQVVSTRAGYLTLLGRDASGRVSVYYDQLVTSGGRFSAPDSLILDAGGGDEEWLLVFDPQARPASDYGQAFAHGELPEAAHAVFRLHRAQP